MARAAAQWLVLMESGAANEADHKRFENWRQSSGSHATAWDKAQLLQKRFSGLPTNLALAALDRPDLGRREVFKRTLAVAAVVPSAWLLSRQLPLDVWNADLQTATSETKRVPLAGGSSLQLNTASAVNVDMQAQRLTLLRGEIALTVPASAALTINAPFGVVGVSNSAVCVRLNDADCEVSVVSGVVQLQPLQGARLALREGQQVSLTASGAGAVGAFDAQLPGWREGVLMAQNQPLGDFLRELSRYRPGLLRWEPALETLRVSGSFRLDNTDRVLSLLAASLPLEVHARTRYWVTLVARNKTA